MGSIVQRTEKTVKIAYITEQKLHSDKINGSITRDLKLISVLKRITDRVDIYFADTSLHHKYKYLIKNKNSLYVISEINKHNYDAAIISTFPISPYLQTYCQIQCRKIFYFCDSAYNMHKNTPLYDFIHKITTSIFVVKESAIIKNYLCVYLGIDEIESLPPKFRKHSVVFPFFTGVQQSNHFDPSGFVLFLGEFNYWPNREAFKRIVKLAPRIKSTIRIFGMNIPSIKYFPINVEICGYAKKLDDIYSGAKALIYPALSGTGIKNKVIEAMSYGIPVIGFKNAFTNMNVEHNKNCIVVKSIKELVESLNREDLNEISRNAYRFIKNEMTEERSLKIIKKIIFEEDRID
ncbi:MAG: glycosyltransferase family 4 protein [Bacteroidales bacterium]|jgi:glycosyltransferase involved in cell wall biosynthesis|nr:glycosyltransferase family 4 protein [Bacteroidales bacterium]